MATTTAPILRVIFVSCRCAERRRARRLALVIAASLLAACANAGVDTSADAAPERAGPDASPDDSPPGPVFPDAGPSSVCGDGIIDTADGEVCDDRVAAGGACAPDCRSVNCPFPSSYLDPTTHRCFWRSQNVVNRDAAAQACASGSGYLVRWSTDAERDAAYQPTVGDIGGRVWVGARKVNDTWTWDDGTPAGPELNFREREPSGDGNCTEWGPGNSINDIPCDVTRDYVCSRDPPGTPASE